MGKRGPQPMKPTRAQREEVALLVAGGMGEERIAKLLGLARMTLRKHFSDELDHGRCIMQKRMLDLLMKSAVKGNVSAQKFLAARMDVNAAPPRPDPLGKKETAQREAQTAHEDSSWGNLLN